MYYQPRRCAPLGAGRTEWAFATRAAAGAPPQLPLPAAGQPMRDMDSDPQTLEALLRSAGFPPGDIEALLHRYQRWRQRGDPRADSLPTALRALLADGEPSGSASRGSSRAAPPEHAPVDAPLHAGPPPEGANGEARTVPQIDLPGSSASPGASSPGRPSPQRPLLTAGERVDQYEVIRFLGRGGMGTVYLCRDVLLGRKAALKVVHPRLVASSEAVDRFLIEARATARFSHPHIVTVYGLGQVHGCPYLALEHLEGRTLRERLRAGALPPREAAAIGLRVAQALSEAHRQAVLHCDLKPENILLPRDGRLRVVDFGLAQILSAGDGPAPPHRRVQGVDAQARASAAEAHAEPAVPSAHAPDGTSSRVELRGTVGYMAPEQWLGEPLGPEIDIWAFGVVLYELLAGRRPFEGPAVQVYAEVTADDYQAPSPPLARPEDPVARALGELCTRCLQQNPAQRPDAAELADVLARLVAVPETLRALAAPPDEGGEAPESASRAAPSPFRGLAPFRRSHAAWFFGRDAEAEAAVERLRETPLLAVVGASGAGKSSFVQAGILPRLETLGPWELLVLRPGRDPLRALAHALLRDPLASGESGSPPLPRVDTRAPRPDDVDALAQRLREEPVHLGRELRARARQRGVSVLLMVDQFEEVFTLCPSQEDRARFCESLLYAADDPASPVRAILTLREDFLSRLARFPALIREVTRGIVVIRTPGPEALREILEAPVQRLGYRYEDDALVREMVAAVAEEPAGLPLLQFAATRLWEARDREARILPRRAYEEIGGVAGALADHADAVIEGLVGPAAAAARTILVQLVTPEGTRVSRSQAEILGDAGPGGPQALERLVEARLLVARRSAAGASDAVEVELVHESLISRWGRLRRWLEESREEVALRAELEVAVAQWERRGRRDEDLWRGRALAEALDFRARRPQALTEPARLFLDRSERAARQQASRRLRLQAAGVVAVVLLVAAGISLLWVTRQERIARRARADAVSAQEKARSRMAAALLEGAESAYLRGDYHIARAKLRAAFEVADSTRARALFDALNRDPRRFRAVHPESVFSVAVSPDGRQVATGTYVGTIRLWDRETGEVRVLRGHRKEVFALDYCPDGGTLVSGAGDGDVRLWKVAVGSSQRVTSHGARVLAVACGPEGRRVASASGDGELKVITTGQPQPLRLRGHVGRITGVRFAAEGTRLVSAGADGTLRIWHLPSGHAVVLRNPQGALESLAVSPDGRAALTGDGRGEVRRWDLEKERSQRLQRLPRAATAVAWPRRGGPLATGDEGGGVWIWRPEERRFRRLGRHRDRVSSLRYGPRGVVLASGSYDRTVQVWNPAVPPPPAPSGHVGWVSGVAFRPDGRELASASQDRTVRLWDVSTGVSRVLRGHTGRVMAVAYRPDGRELASAGFDQTVRLWRPDSPTPQILRGHTAPIYALAYEPRQGRLLATASADHTVRLWHLAEGRVTVLRGHRDRVFGVSFDPGGRRVVSGSWDGTLRIWDVSSGRPLRVIQAHRGRISAVAWSPRGARIASAGYDRTLRLWDAASGRRLRVFRGHTDYVWGLAFSPDGRTLASASRDRTVRLWDVETGAVKRVVRGHTLDVNRVAFSPKGDLLATGSDDTTVRLWHRSTGRPVWRALALLRPPNPGLLRPNGRIGLDGFGRRPPPIAPPVDPAEQRLLAALSRSMSRAHTGGTGDLLAWVDPLDRVVLWSRRKGRLWERRWPGATQAVPLSEDAALVLARGAVVRLAPGPRPPRPVVAQRVRRILSTPTEWLLVAARAIHVLDRAGHPRFSVPVAPGATAAVRLARTDLLVGFRDGTVERVSTHGSRRPTHRPLEGVPAVPITALAPGPMGTLSLGLRDGSVGLWDLGTGKRLAWLRLHGPVSTLHRAGQRIYAVTALGDTAQIDLSVFHAADCDILRRIWSRCPATWDRGRPERRPPPPGHRCTTRWTRKILRHAAPRLR